VIAYVLVEHSPVEVGMRGTDRIVRRVLEPHALPLCASCHSKVVRTRRRAAIVANAMLGGIAIGALGIVALLLGRFVDAELQAWSFVLLFSGLAWMLGAAVLFAMLQRAVLASLPTIPANRGRDIVLVTTSRDELDRELAELRAASAEIRNELARTANAENLPVARVNRD
jgi:hypothetical protein